MKTLSLLGVKVNQVDYPTTLRQIEKFIKTQQPHHIVTVNPEIIMRAQKDEEFRRVLNAAELSVPDGFGIIWASKIFKKPLKERVTGTDLVNDIARLAAKRGYRIYFLGGEEGVAKKAALNLQQKYPQLKIAGFEAGSPYDATLISRIRKLRPEILLVAFGAPKQEKWLNKFKTSLNVPVMMGVGGAFDFISGKVPRAPLWMRQRGLEWLYRLIKQPWRYKRQFALLLFLLAVLKEALFHSGKTSR